MFLEPILDKLTIFIGLLLMRTMAATRNCITFRTFDTFNERLYHGDVAFIIFAIDNECRDVYTINLVDDTPTFEAAYDCELAGAVLQIVSIATSSPKKHLPL